MQASEIAWQPLTPGGVAVFARTRLANLLAVQLVVALVAAAVVVWFLATAWFPVVGAAVQQLPVQGEIRSRQLNWSGEPAVVLAANRFLALSVDLKHEGQARSPAHLQCEFGRSDFRALSLLGVLELRYPRGWIVAFNRAELQPWWGAWSPVLLAVAAAAVVLGLVISWAILATVYSWICWLIGFFANRDLTLRGSWRLAGAALMPGALFMSGAVFLYGLGILDLVKLLVATAAHLPIGWVYLAASPFWCPPHPATVAQQGNPFKEAITKTEPAGER